MHERNGIKTSQKDIEDYFGVAHPTIIRILQQLESKGFVTSAFDSDDKRIKNIYLTDHTVSFYRVMGDTLGQMEEILLHQLTDAQIKELRGLLNKVYNNIENL